MPDPKPVPPTGYKITTGMDVPMGNKLSPDIEDRRDWGEFRKVMGEKGQDFRDYWRDVRNSYPDFHSAYKVVRDTILGKAAPVNQPVSNTQMHNANNSLPTTPMIGATKKFANDKIGTWDGHGWRATK